MYLLFYRKLLSEYFIATSHLIHVDPRLAPSVARKAETRTRKLKSSNQQPQLRGRTPNNAVLFNLSPVASACPIFLLPALAAGQVTGASSQAQVAASQPSKPQAYQSKEFLECVAAEEFHAKWKGCLSKDSRRLDTKDQPGALRTWGYVATDPKSTKIKDNGRGWAPRARPGVRPTFLDLCFRVWAQHPSLQAAEARLPRCFLSLAKRQLRKNWPGSHNEVVFTRFVGVTYARMHQVCEGNTSPGRRNGVAVVVKLDSQIPQVLIRDNYMDRRVIQEYELYYKQRPCAWLEATVARQAASAGNKNIGPAEGQARADSEKAGNNHQTSTAGGTSIAGMFKKSLQVNEGFRLLDYMIIVYALTLKKLDNLIYKIPAQAKKFGWLSSGRGVGAKKKFETLQTLPFAGFSLTGSLRNMPVSQGSGARTPAVTSATPNLRRVATRRPGSFGQLRVWGYKSISLQTDPATSSRYLNSKSLGVGGCVVTDNGYFLQWLQQSTVGLANRVAGVRTPSMASVKSRSSQIRGRGAAGSLDTSNLAVSKRHSNASRMFQAANRLGSSYAGVSAVIVSPPLDLPTSLTRLPRCFSPAYGRGLQRSQTCPGMYNLENFVLVPCLTRGKQIKSWPVARESTVWPSLANKASGLEATTSFVNQDQRGSRSSNRRSWESSQVLRFCTLAQMLPRVNAGAQFNPTRSRFASARVAALPKNRYARITDALTPRNSVLEYAFPSQVANRQEPSAFYTPQSVLEPVQDAYAKGHTVPVESRQRLPAATCSSLRVLWKRTLISGGSGSRLFPIHRSKRAGASQGSRVSTTIVAQPTTPSRHGRSNSDSAEGDVNTVTVASRGKLWLRTSMPSRSSSLKIYITSPTSVLGLVNNNPS
jgi:hypothetical protein